MKNAAGSPPLSPAPTHVRYGVLGFACSLSMLTYLDRACVASAATILVSDLGLSSVADLRWAFAAFALAYALFEVPAGWWGDRFGPRRVLIRIVLWWSVFTALTGCVGMKYWRAGLRQFLRGGGKLFGLSVPMLVVTPLATLVIFRFLFGMGEAGAFPNITRALHNWFPLQERGFAQGAVWMSGRLMGGLTPIVWMVLVEGIGRSRVPPAGPGPLAPAADPLAHRLLAFWPVGTGLVPGLRLLVPQLAGGKAGGQCGRVSLDPPRRPAAPSRGGPHPLGPHPRSRNLWAVCAMYGLQSFGWYFYITYLPRFLEEQFAVPSTSLLGAVYKGGPLWLGAVGA